MNIDVNKAKLHIVFTPEQRIIEFAKSFNGLSDDEITNIIMNVINEVADIRLDNEYGRFIRLRLPYIAYVFGRDGYNSFGIEVNDDEVADDFYDYNYDVMLNIDLDYNKNRGYREVYSIPHEHKSLAGKYIKVYKRVEK